MIKSEDLSIILPAKNEAENIGATISELVAYYPSSEVIVVNDGSTDSTESISVEAGASVINHPYSKGNGAAIKTGVRSATRKYVICMDSDGQHSPKYIKSLMQKMSEGYDMVVGARDENSQANLGRWAANKAYNWLASKMVSHEVLDLTSGFRIIKRSVFYSYLYLLPNGFSYPTTITMALFRAGYSVGYIDISANKRKGNSHIKAYLDGFKFLLIIFKIGTLYSPLKIFAPLSVLCFIFGLFNYTYSYVVDGRFTNMSMLLFSLSVIVFLVGLVSEQITALMYKGEKPND